MEGGGEVGVYPLHDEAMSKLGATNQKSSWHLASEGKGPYLLPVNLKFEQHTNNWYNKIISSIFLL